MSRAWLLVLVVGLLLPGCVQLERKAELHGLINSIVPEHTGKSVGIQSRHSTPSRPLNKTVMGRGAVIARDLVLTASHVVKDADGNALPEVWVDPSGWGRYWIKGKVIAYIDAPIEPLAVIQIPLTRSAWCGFTGWDAGDWYEISPTGEPHAVETARGPYYWMPGCVKAGDSGSPVVDTEGRLVGVVWGVIGPWPTLLPIGEEYLGD